MYLKAGMRAFFREAAEKNGLKFEILLVMLDFFGKIPGFQSS
jgi:hypothetical protein